MVNPMPKVIYDAFWAMATYAPELRRESFEASFQLIMVSIDEIEFVMTLIPEWFIAYNEAVEGGLAPISDPCPCDDF
jgi:hypothetical protein